MLKAELSWKRVSNTTLSSGQIRVTKDDLLCECKLFEELKFEDMIELLSEVLQNYEKMPVFFRRLERPNLVPLQLEESTVELLRIDFMAAVEALTWEATPITKSAVPVVDKTVSPIERGITSIIDVFGDQLYCRHRNNGTVECPGCGLWSFLEDAKIFRCQKRCRLTISGKIIQVTKDVPSNSHDGWFQILTEDLLRTEGFGGRYYLPLPWNTNGPRINREDLLKQFENWNQIKESLSC